VHCGHSDDEAEQVVNDGVQEFVEEGVLWHVLYRLQFVVYVQLGVILTGASVRVRMIAPLPNTDSSAALLTYLPFYRNLLNF